jgi:hypothetical protein
LARFTASFSTELPQPPEIANTTIIIMGTMLFMALPPGFKT